MLCFNDYFNIGNISNIGKAYAILLIFTFAIHNQNLTITFGTYPY